LSFFILALVIFFWVKVKKIDEILFYGLLFSLPFDLGKSFPFSVVLPLASSQEIGYRVWLTVSPSLILSFLLLAHLFFNRKKKLKTELSDKYLILFLFLTGFSIIIAPLKTISFYAWLELLKAVTIYFSARLLLQRKTVFKNCFYIISSWVCFEGLFALGQYFLKGSLGRYIEEGLLNIPLGKVMENKVFLFRSFGTFVSPNRLGAFLVISLILLSPIFFKKSFIKINAFFFAAFVLGLIGLVLSFSRTSWFSFFIFSLSGVYWLYKKGHRFGSQIKRIILMSLIFLIFLSPFLVLRLNSLLTSFSYYGSGSVRLKLIQEALHLIFLKPFFGVGLNHFTWGVVEWPLTDIRHIFLQPVHSVYLLIASEAGLPSLLFFLFFIISVLKRVDKNKEKVSQKLYPLFVLGRNAVLSYLFIGLLEPFFLQPVFDLFFLSLAILEVVSNKK